MGTVGDRGRRIAARALDGDGARASRKSFLAAARRIAPPAPRLPGRNRAGTDGRRDPSPRVRAQCGLMDYAQFLRLRESEWADFAHRLGKARQHPNRLDYDALESLALQYRQILQDHALASSRFPGTGASR